MSQTIEINFARPFPVFPLPGCVLLPHGSLQLHIFEPRYRQMVKDAIDSFGLIAMGLFDGEVSKDDYLDGRPPLRTFVCVGYIEKYEPLEDGRFLLLLRGLCRTRIMHEADHKPYRTFHLEPTDLDQEEGDSMNECRERLQDLLNDPVLQQIEGVDVLGDLLDKPIPTTALIDIVAMHICEEADKRYPLLAEPSVDRRAEAVTAHLEALRREMDDDW